MLLDTYTEITHLITSYVICEAYIPFGAPGIQLAIALSPVPPRTARGQVSGHAFKGKNGQWVNEQPLR